MSSENQFSVSNQGDYIHLKTWGQPASDNLEAPANAALAMAKESNVTKLLDDIREVSSKNIPLGVQIKAAGILWRLRQFKKVAVVVKDKELSAMFFTVLEEMHLSKTFKGFADEAEAINWLREDS